MKLRQIEKYLGLAIIVLMTLKLTNVFSSTILLLLFCMALSILYFAIGHGIFNNNTLKESSILIRKPPYLQVISIGFGVGFAIIVMGFIWDILSLPGSSIQLIAGTFILLVFSFILVITRQKYELEFRKSVFIRTIIAIAIASFTLAKPNHFYLKIQHRNNPEFIEAVIKVKENPQDSLLWENVRKLEQDMKK